MALLMPDINLRRDRRHLQRHWRHVLRGDSIDSPRPAKPRRVRARQSDRGRRAPDANSPSDAQSQQEPKPGAQPDMELESCSSIVVNAGDPKSIDGSMCECSAAKSITSNQDTEDEDVCEVHDAMEETPTIKGDAATDAAEVAQMQPVDGSSNRERQKQSEALPPPSWTRPPRPPPSSSSSSVCSSAPVAPHAVVTVFASNSEQAPRSKRRGGSGRGIRLSHSRTPPPSNSKFVSRIEGPTLGAIMQRVHVNDGDVCELDFSALALRNKRLEAVGCTLVARSLSTNHTVRKLIIRDHAIGDDGAVALAKMLCNNTTLQCLDLYGNGIGDRGAEALAEALYGHDSLTHLFLWSNVITDRGALALAQAVRCNCTLKCLGLVHNCITRVGGQAFLDALDVNFNLESLNLSTNEVPKSISNLISAALMRNRAEAPMVHSQMAEEEAEITRRLAEMSGYAEEENDDEDEYWEDDGDDSESSGFLTCSGVTDIPLSSSGLWI